MFVVAYNVIGNPFGQVIACAPNGDDLAVVLGTGEIVTTTANAVGVHNIPPDITYGEFAKHHTQYRVLCASNLQVGHPVDMWRSLATCDIPHVNLWAVARIIEYTGRSTFWLSLRDQILQWTRTPHQSRFPSPLSKRQLDTVLRDVEHVAKGKRLVADINNGVDLRPVREVIPGLL